MREIAKKEKENCVKGFFGKEGGFPLTLVMGRIKIRCTQYQPPKGGLDIHRYLLAVELVVFSIDSTIFSYIGTRAAFSVSMPPDGFSQLRERLLLGQTSRFEGDPWECWSATGKAPVAFEYEILPQSYLISLPNDALTLL